MRAKEPIKIGIAMLALVFTVYGAQGAEDHVNYDDPNLAQDESAFANDLASRCTNRMAPAELKSCLQAEKNDASIAKAVNVLVDSSADNAPPRRTKTAQ